MKLEQELVKNSKKLEFHKCEKCPRVFSDLCDLLQHALYHQEKFLSHITSSYILLERIKTFQCDSRTEIFCSKKEFLLHKAKHVPKYAKNARQASKFHIDSTTPKPYKCQQCEYSFVAEATLQEHSILHLPFPHICHCGVGFYEAQDLEDHKRLVHFNETHNLLPHIKSEYKSSDDEESPTKKTPRPMLKAVLKEKKKRKRHNIAKPDIEIASVGDKFECPECKKLLVSKSSVYIHYRIHTGQKPFQCDICNQSFSQQTTLTSHRNRHTDDKNFKCQTCDKTFSTAIYLRRHLLIHQDLKPYTCTFCGKGFNDTSACARHKRIHTGDKRYKCPFCPKAFTDVSGLAGHKRRHFNRKMSCKICDKKFYDKYELDNHMFVHTKQKNIECDYCHKCFCWKGTLIKHIKICHTEAKYHKCKHCSRKFNSKGNLKTHTLRVHLNVKRFICHLCEKGFYLRSSWVGHMAAHQSMHPDEFPYECDHCAKKFTSKPNLFRHIVNIHMRIQCHRCHRKFPTKIDLERHLLDISERCEVCGDTFYCLGLKDSHIMKAHISVKQYECDSCGRIFDKRNSIVKHIASHHGDVKYQCHDCNKSYFIKCSLRKHILHNHFEKIKCKECFKVFFKLSDFNRHKATGCVLIKYSCNICSKSFKTKRSLKEHMYAHSNGKSFQCKLCLNRFSSKKALQRHDRTVHGEKTPQADGYRNLFLSQIRSILMSTT